MTYTNNLRNKINDNLKTLMLNAKNMGFSKDQIIDIISDFYTNDTEDYVINKGGKSCDLY